MKKLLKHWGWAGFLCVALLAVTLLISTQTDTARAASWPTYGQGSSGENIRSIQYLLRQRGYSLDVDGIYGAATEAAVKDFQSKNGLSADGIVGPDTWSKLIVTLRSGSSGAAVTALQRQLNAHGASLTVDGAFGAATEAAVKSFQSKSGLSADGIAGPDTWNRLIAGGGSDDSTKLTHSQAMSMLRANGISVVSSGNCSDRNRSNCTSLEQVRRNTIEQIIAFKQKSGCAITITGGTETGHASGTYSHWNGYKLDIQPTSCVSNYITGHFKAAGTRGDGAKLYTDGADRIYARESNHWDITYK